MSRGRPLEIAIVGMGCRFPGSEDLCAYWENILAGKDCIRDVPADRWDSATFVDPSSTANDRVPCGRGGYLDAPIDFDAAEHGIMPRTIEGGEPEQFLVLDAATAALDDAGLTPADLKGRRVEVVIGRGNYFNRGNLTRLQHGRIAAQTLSILSGLHPEWSEADREAVRAGLKSGLPPFEAGTIAGQLTNATAGRLAHRLDLGGAAFVVDAASASSMVALDLAARALTDRRVDLAIVGGVYVEADVDFPLVFRQLGAMSPSGTARPFAADADGMLSGEGVGVLVLKRRCDAERDGDRIYAVVQGLGLTSDGKGRGLAVPSARGHARAIRRAYRRSGIDPATVMLVEGHGLGVPASDRAELRALNAVFPPPPYGRRALGAVSSMIGHAMPAAGMAGLIKTALAVYHGVLPPTLHAESPHPLLDSSKSAFALNGATRPWIHPDPDTPRRAGVNAFGFAGINAHAVLEEHADSAEGDAPGGFRRWETEAILLSAPDRAGLVEKARELMAWVGRHWRGSLKDVAYTLNRGDAPSERLGLVASSLDDLYRKLEAIIPRLADPACRAAGDGRGTYHRDRPLGGTLAFLFPGEGSQYPGMLADLCLHFPEVRRQFDTADRIALELGDPVPPSEHLFMNSSQEGAEIWSAATGVNVVLNAQWALYQVLTRLGLRPDAVAGHSSGEVLALAAAGVLGVDRELEQQLGRLGAIFRGFESSGEMPPARLVAVAAGRDHVASTIRELGASEVGIAIDNCPHQVVLAGPPEEVDRVVGRLREQNILLEVLPFARPYHTPSFGAVLDPIRDSFSRLTFRTPVLPIYSCATRGRMPDDPEAIRELAVAQWTRTVAFRETIEAMYADGVRLFIDVGARGNLAGFVQDTLRGRPAFAIGANVPRRSGLTQLNHLVAALFAQGVSIRTDFLYARRRPRLIDWIAPEVPRRTTVELKLGFPEMSLSNSMIDRLRSKGTPEISPAKPASNPATYDDAFAGSGGRGRTAPGAPVEPERNGSAQHEEARPAASPIVYPVHSRLSANPDLLTWGSRIDEAAGETQPAQPPEVAGAMLAFQETMRSFLETQHEIMSAYLGSSTNGSWPEAESADEIHFFTGSGSNGHGGNGFHVEDMAAASDTFEPGYGPTLSGPELGPWVGAVRRLVAGSEIEAICWIDVHGDPIAEHHTLGGRRVSALDPTLKGLPVLPFAVMAEMAAEAAALVVAPGLVLTGLREVRAHKWVRYEASPVCLEFRGHRVESGDDERVRVGIYNRGTDGQAAAARPVFEAVAVFEPAPPAPPPAAPWTLKDARECRFTAESIYDEQWLFHGPALQAVVEIGTISAHGIDGTLRVLPWEPLLRPGEPARLHTDAIVIDNFTHLLGCWGLDELADAGDVVFPLGMEALQLFGDRPPVGTDVACRIAILEIDRHRIRVEAEIVRTDGTVWMRIRDWDDWRFHWPGRYRDVFRQPRDVFVGEALPLEGMDSGAMAVWLSPPADMGRPVWRDVLEQTQLGPAELAAHLALGGPERRRSHRLWGRAADLAGRRPACDLSGRPGGRQRRTRPTPADAPRLARRSHARHLDRPCRGGRRRGRRPRPGRSRRYRRGSDRRSTGGLRGRGLHAG
jgi:acyl transferase domain-containing protein